MRTLAAFLMLGVLAPTGAVLWFMNDAARSQAEAARQNVTEAYRGQMRLLRDRIDALWRQKAAALDRPLGFEAAIDAAGADSAVLLDANGGVQYPVTGLSAAADPLSSDARWVAAEALEAKPRLLDAAAAYEVIARSSPDPSMAARAAQAQIRCLIRGGRKDMALAAIGRSFTAGRPSRGRDFEGRWIAADEQLLGVQLAGHDPALRRRFADRLASWLNRYEEVEIPSAQRVFLMRELAAAVPELPPFPRYEAERLALEFAAPVRIRKGTAALEPSGIAGVWKLSSANGRIVALYRTASAEREVATVLGSQTGNARFAAGPVGSGAGMDPMPAGATMPGWQLSYTLVDASAVDQASRRRTATYLWIGYAAVALVAVAGLLAAGAFGRQLRLARLKTDLVASVSHELRTPLASMRLLVDTLLEEGAADGRKTREYLALIAAENARLSRLIENFLTFSRIERRRQRYEFGKVSPAQVVEDAVLAMRERLPNAAVTVEVSRGLPEIHADADAVVAVLLNLLENAWKYTGAEKRIALSASADGEGVNFFVQDNGIGIPPREQKRIFRRFYQVDQRLARERGGCGLGLSIVDAIVRAHNGFVEVKSAVGAGSTFRVWLPREARA